MVLLSEIENFGKILINPVTLDTQTAQGVAAPRRQPFRPSQHFLVYSHALPL
jgi:hypothetical protein